MADKQYGWLDAETAERLLRGESLDNAVDAAARDEAERLAQALGALSAAPPADSAELPGEAAALAAFRTARADRDKAVADRGETAAAPTPAAPAVRARGDRRFPSAAPGPRASGSGAHPPADDAGLVRIGAPAHRAPRARRGRPVRFGMAAALALGMVGTVTVAAATGMLPTPFGDEEPRPGATASAAATTDRPLASPSPDDTGEGEPTPDDSAVGTPDDSPPRSDAGGAPSTDPGSGTDGRGKGGFGSRWDGAPAACRDLRDGERLSADRKRALERLAGGSNQVWKYCKDVLRTGDGKAGQDDGRQERDREKDGRDGHDRQGGADDSHHDTPGRGHRSNGGLSTPSPSPTADDTTPLPKRAVVAPSPNPSYSAL